MEGLLTGGEGGEIGHMPESHYPAQMHFFFLCVFLFVFTVFALLAEDNRMCAIRHD